MDGRKNLGNFGERLAVTALLRQGYKIRGRQVRTPFGEIDIIAEAPDHLIFVEVKTRRTAEFGAPEEAITEKKREHLANAVESYRLAEGLLDRPFRVDAIAIFLDEAKRKATVRHIKNILED
ncbi:YraN family protein [Patescibacteria group bacterium]|nr:MAG: YraN family protein [Patescibacteria group bacterium]